ncbi:hypothetical protein Tco_0659146 [Tanacetum coccineum]
MSREAIEKDIYDRILILQEPRPIIKTLNFSDQHKKLLNVLLDKLKLDGEVKIDEEEAIEEVIRGYKTIIRNKHEESDDDEEEHCVKKDKNGKPIYGPKFVKYLNCDDPIDRALALQEALNPFRKICDGKWHAKVRVIDKYGNIYDQSGSEKNFSETSGTSYRAAKTKYNTNLARLLSKQIYSPVIVEWEVLNNMGCAEEIEEMLEIKVYEMGGDEEIFTFEAWRCAFDIREPVYAELCHEFYATYEFDETVTDEDLMSRKVIKFRLGGHGHTSTILEFARRLGLYFSDEIQDKGFET